MRIAVFSDSHGAVSPLCRAILACQPDMALHLGDYVRDALALQEAFPALDVRYVRGNCDLGVAAPERLCFTAEGVAIFMAHGHQYAVKRTRDTLVYAAQEQGARLALYGHTHQEDYGTLGGVTLLNPGAAGEGGRFALLQVEGGTFSCQMRAL